MYSCDGKSEFESAI